MTFVQCTRLAILCRLRTSLVQFINNIVRVTLIKENIYLHEYTSEDCKKRAFCDADSNKRRLRCLIPEPFLIHVIMTKHVMWMKIKICFSESHTGLWQNI